jgi:uncharacterized protein YdaU (DUF1376 family)
MTSVNPPEWFPCNITKEMADARFLSAKARAAHHNIMLHYFHDCGLPNDDDQVRKIADITPRDWHAVREELQKKLFTRDWRHPRWDQDIERMDSKRAKRSLAAQAGVEARRAQRPAVDDTRKRK